MKPTLTKLKTKRAVSAASAKSQASTNEQAMPATTPLTAAIIGFSRRSSASTTSAPCSVRWRPTSALRPSRPGSLMRLMSAPAENARPAPVSTITRTSSSSSACATSSGSRSFISGSSALSCSGRLSVIVAMPSATS